MIATDAGDKFAALYEYAIKQLGPNPTSEARRTISRRLREVIIKIWTLAGLPRVFAAYYALASVEGPDGAAIDPERAEQRATLPLDQLTSRATDWMMKELPEEAEGIWKSLAGNPDLGTDVCTLQPVMSKS